MPKIRFLAMNKKIKYSQKYKAPLLILDLDYTLMANTDGAIIPRPYLYEFLESVSKNMELWIWSAGIREYVESVVEQLKIKHYFSQILCREDCIKIGDNYIKSLS